MLGPVTRDVVNLGSSTVNVAVSSSTSTAAVSSVLDGLPGLRLDPGQPSAPYGLIFRKPAALRVRWDDRSAQVLTRGELL